MHRPKLLATFLLAAIFLLAACTNAPTQPSAEGVAPAVPSPSEALNIETESAEVVEPAGEQAPATVEPASGAASEPTPTGNEVREVRAGLEASDPAAFEIASGDVQLVEFFAFW